MKHKITVPFYPRSLLFFKSFNNLIQFFLQMQHYSIGMSRGNCVGSLGKFISCHHHQHKLCTHKKLL